MEISGFEGVRGVKPGSNLGLNVFGCLKLLKIWVMNAQQKHQEDFEQHFTAGSAGLW